MQTPQLWGDMRSRMSREAHVWICEGLGGGGSPGLLDWGLGEKDPRLPDWTYFSLNSCLCFLHQFPRYSTAKGLIF